MVRRKPYNINTGVHIRWFTVRRRSVYGLATFALAATVFAYYDPAPPAGGSNLTDGAADIQTSRLVHVRGDVRVRRAGSNDWLEAHERMELGPQDTVRTARGAEARIRLIDGTHYVLDPASVLIIEAAHEVTVHAGRVQMQTPPDDAVRKVTTPTMRSTIEPDTDASIHYDRANQTSTLKVHRGGASVESGTDKTQLRTNQAVRIGTDRNHHIRELPGIPEPVFPVNGVAILPSEAIEFRWAKVASAAKYSLVLGRTHTLVDPILESTVSSHTLLHQPLGTGTYFWQVSAVDHAGERSAPSAIARFTVRRNVELATAPELHIVESSVSIDGFVALRGRTSVPASVTIDYGRGEESVGLGTDGSFRAYFVLGPGQRSVHVRARATGRTLAETTIRFDVGGNKAQP